MAVVMTKEWLLKHCKERGLYQTPYLNDRLYLQCQAICDIQNLEEYTGVKLLYLEENCLESMNGLQSLKQLQCLILDLSHNKLNDGNGLLEIAQGLPRLAVMYLTGNPCISRMPHYRKNIIGNIKNLTHLDDRPVFWDERLYAEAWLRGGHEAETAERDRVRQIRADEETKQFESMRRMREQSMEERLHVARPNYLHFDPEELGEDDPDTCDPNDRTQVHQPRGMENSQQTELSHTLPGEKEWVGSDLKADSYCNIHNNTLFSENTVTGGDPELEPLRPDLPKQEDQEPEQTSRPFSTVRQSGRYALASLATLENDCEY
ncbi:hypothetical protein R1sor_012912 [Riccia sorocarpa]|uniref:Dynein assembly factor 1, axonemal homolog n=1 Tax=Riccia sorocarpa TaxID=122646 RepID=A0ABD3I696_9MARC